MVREGAVVRHSVVMTDVVIEENAVVDYAILDKRVWVGAGAKVGYGKGCPWSCPHTRPGIEYRAEDYPEAVRLVEEFLCIGHSQGGITPPNSTDLMQMYVDALNKVMVDNRDEFTALVRQEEGE